MRKIVTVITIVFLIAQGALAQEEEPKMEKKTTFAVNLVHNSVAGFAPVLLGSREIKENLNLTFYSIFWTNPTFGTISNGGDLFLETGVGLGFTLLDKKLYVNPTLGIGHGKFLSGGEETLLAEGLIPNIFTLYNSGRFEFEGYLAYYGALRRGGAVTRDFLLNWIVPGIKVSNNFSLGGYYEQFVLSRTTDNVGEKSIYQWLGGYVKLNFSGGKFVRLAVGTNTSEDGVGDDFYKISVFLPIN